MYRLYSVQIYDVQRPALRIRTASIGYSVQHSLLSTQHPALQYPAYRVQRYSNQHTASSVTVSSIQSPALQYPAYRVQRYRVQRYSIQHTKSIVTVSSIQSPALRYPAYIVQHRVYCTYNAQHALCPTVIRARSVTDFVEKQ
jgi:hypothetical protein